MRENAAPLLAAGAAAYALKRFYSSATADDLCWLLDPTAQLVGWVSGHSFIREHGTGYLSRELGVLIAPSCAGANYLITAFLLLSVGFVWRVPGIRFKWGWLALSALGAYGATLLVNACRIVLTIGLKSRDLAGVSFEQLHRIEGVLVYLSSLWLLYYGAEKLCGAAPFTHPLPVVVIPAPSALRRVSLWFVPWTLYLGITLVVPLLNGAASPAYVAHAGTVLFVSTASVAALTALTFAAAFASRKPRA
jgi:exosortase K